MISNIQLAIKRYQKDGIRGVIDGVLREVVRKNFDFLQSHGIHALPVHFYTPIPDTRDLDDDLWISNEDPPGVELQADAQLKWLTEFSSKYQNELSQIPADSSRGYHFDNPQFGPIDGHALFGMMMSHKPDRMIEIGSGWSTKLASEVITEFNIDCEFTAIEPYPDSDLKELNGLDELIERPVQDVSIDEFKQLGENDILFIDSSHVLKTGSDVQYEYLNILPKLEKGVLVHIHDIFIPDEYPRNWIYNKQRFWNEQYLLQAFLTFNSAYNIQWMSHYLVSRHRKAVESAFDDIESSSIKPSSLWMKRSPNSIPE